MIFVRSGGQVVIGGSSVQTSAISIDNPGTKLQFDSTTTAQVTVNDGTTLSGSGSVGAVSVLAGGTIAPGSPIGKLTAASLSMASTASMSIEIAGTVAGSTHDWLSITGAATLGGTLNDRTLKPVLIWLCDRGNSEVAMEIFRIYMNWYTVIWMYRNWDKESKLIFRQ